jgi:hypothetical protein
MKSDRLVAWVERRSGQKCVAAFVSVAAAFQRAPAVRHCTSPAAFVGLLTVDFQ